MLHMIGNAHIDPVWLWRWTDGCAEAMSTCWAAIDRLDEGTEFIFTRGEAQIYAWIEELDPPLFARIKDYIAEGRWVVVNGWWIQPDCNIPSGEAIIRQALYGKRYFAERFGVDVPVGYNVDSFGHAATFPMLLTHTETSAYVFMRPGPHEIRLPANLFDWRSSDGSMVTAFRIQDAYSTTSGTTPIDKKIVLQLAMSAAEGQPYMCFYGVGNHGGGPTKKHIAAIIEAKAKGLDVTFSDPNRYFRELPVGERPIVDQELQFHAIGCYAAAGELKALNRRAEARLVQAEAAATLASRVTGASYPHAELERLWRSVLFNQFHDTLGGTSIQSACDDALNDFRAVLSGAMTIVNASVRHLDRTIAPVSDPTDATILLANFNPHDFDGVCEVEPWTDFDTNSPRLLIDTDGTEVPFQYVNPEPKTEGLQRLAFRTTVPGYGYRLLRFTKHKHGIVAPSVNFGGRAAPGQRVFETAGWRLEIDTRTGAIGALVNKRTGLPVFTGGAHTGTIVDDPSDTWSHGLDRFGFEGEGTVLEAINILEEGPIRTSIEVIATAGSSRFRTIVVLPADPDLPVDLRVTLDWHEKQKLLRLAFPLAGSRFEYEIAAGWVERPDDGREVVGQRWVRAVRPDVTVALINDAKYSYAAKHGTLFITALRSPVYAHHDPVKLQSGALYRYLDQGEQSFTIRIAAGSDVARKDTMRLANDLLCPPVATPHVARGGTAPHHGQWLKIDSAGSAVIAMKQAEDGDATIVRAIELDGRQDELILDGARLPIKPRGILTARLAGGTITECNGLER